MQLNHKIFGQGPPLIVLHGLFGTLDNWQTLAKRWADDYTVVLLDLRNHGRSPHVATHDYPGMAEDLKVFMEANWMYEAHILGHSMGGKTAMQFALHYPDMVNKLVVVDIAPKDYAGGHEEILNALNDLDLATITDRKDADDFLTSRIHSRGVRQFLLKNLTRTPAGAYEWKMNLPVLKEYYSAILGNVSGGEPFEAPTLFIRGEQSDYIGDDDLALIQTYFPHARLETLTGAGHWVHAEQPEALYQLVHTFLAN